MFLGLTTKLRQGGDTIVEVMVVLAVLGLALSIAYATANRSLLNLRQAEENSTATQLAQSQVEALSTMIANPPGPTNIFQSTPFCISSGTTVKLLPGSPLNTLLYTSTDYVAAGCEQTAFPNFDIAVVDCATIGGDPTDPLCTKGPNSPASGPGPYPSTFVVQVTWPDVLGAGNDYVTLNYKTYPSQ
jgi:type II secretory pathway pseudopilin PulG